MASGDLRKVSDKCVADTSSDSDQEPGPRKKAKISQHDIDKNIKGIKDQLDSLFTVQKTLKVPLALRKIFAEDFQCVCCEGVMKPPIIFSRCCKRLIGCEACIDTWFKGEGARSKQCPHCGTERAFTETSRVNGLDEFLEAIAKLSAD